MAWNKLNEIREGFEVTIDGDQWTGAWLRVKDASIELKTKLDDVTKGREIATVAVAMAKTLRDLTTR